MTRLRKPYILERLVYVVIWLIVFLSPLVIAYWAMNTHIDQSFNWTAVSRMWIYSILPFFLLFCLNNFWLAPYFLLCKKYVRYAFSVLIALCLFIWFDTAFVHRGPLNAFPFDAPRQAMQGYDGQPRERSFTRAPDFQQEEFPPQYGPSGEETWQEESAMPSRSMGEDVPGLRPQPFRGFILMPVIFRWLIAVLMIGFNIAIKLLFKSLQDEEVMKELERRKLQSELEYLKYQINPHFFMNTLNNIHALVDINQMQAKKAIVELSSGLTVDSYDASW